MVFAMISVFWEVLEKLLLVDLEMCFLALLGEVLFIWVSMFSFCFFVEAWMCSLQFARLLWLPCVVLTVSLSTAPGTRPSLFCFFFSQQSFQPAMQKRKRENQS